MFSAQVQLVTGDAHRVSVFMTEEDKLHLVTYEDIIKTVLPRGQWKNLEYFDLRYLNANRNVLECVGPSGKNNLAHAKLQLLEDDDMEVVTCSPGERNGLRVFVVFAVQLPSDRGKTLKERGWAVCRDSSHLRVSLPPRKRRKVQEAIPEDDEKEGERSLEDPEKQRHPTITQYGCRLNEEKPQLGMLMSKFEDILKANTIFVHEKFSDEKKTPTAKFLAPSKELPLGGTQCLLCSDQHVQTESLFTYYESLHARGNYRFIQRHRDSKTARKPCPSLYKKHNPSILSFFSPKPKPSVKAEPKDDQVWDPSNPTMLKKEVVQILESEDLNALTRKMLRKQLEEKHNMQKGSLKVYKAQILEIIVQFYDTHKLWK